MKYDTLGEWGRARADILDKITEQLAATFADCDTHTVLEAMASYVWSDFPTPNHADFTENDIVGIVRLFEGFLRMEQSTIPHGRFARKRVKRKGPAP
jgi:hypothetical protein